MVTLVFTNKRFEDEKYRKMIADQIATVIALKRSEAYPITADTYCWAVDKENNCYWVHFNEEEPNQLKIRCRYDFQRETLNCLAAYLAKRLRGEIKESTDGN